MHVPRHLFVILVNSRPIGIAVTLVAAAWRPNRGAPSEGVTFGHPVAIQGGGKEMHERCERGRNSQKKLTSGKPKISRFGEGEETGNMSWLGMFRI